MSGNNRVPSPRILNNGSRSPRSSKKQDSMSPFQGSTIRCFNGQNNSASPPIFKLNRNSLHMLPKDPNQRTNSPSKRVTQLNNSFYTKGNILKTEEDADYFEHKFPFKTSLHLNNDSINKQTVHLNIRSPQEFSGIDTKTVFDFAYRDRKNYELNLSGGSPMKSIASDQQLNNQGEQQMQEGNFRGRMTAD